MAVSNLYVIDDQHLGCISKWELLIKMFKIVKLL
jgi:hypothetical protein